jgi:hypothetical protein
LRRGQVLLEGHGYQERVNKVGHQVALDRIRLRAGKGD